MLSVPVLYSYRRCPYVMRARMALKYAGILADIREISLKDKPPEMLAASPKGTVPVLVLYANSQIKPVIIEQSLEIMLWALQQHDPEAWLNADKALMLDLITENDGDFKQALDRYKYPVRFPEFSAEVYRAQAEVFLQKLEYLLNQHQFLCGDQMSLADIAIFPFIRQFSAVDAHWFENSLYPALKRWLTGLVESPLFVAIMQKN